MCFLLALSPPVPVCRGMGSTRRRMGPASRGTPAPLPAVPRVTYLPKDPTMFPRCQTAKNAEAGPKCFEWLKGPTLCHLFHTSIFFFSEIETSKYKTVFFQT